MLSRFFASWLVVLVLAPFTAPFSTCDLAGFVGSDTDQHAPLVPPASAAVTHDAAIPSVPCISTAGRIRLLPLAGLSLAQTKASASSARSMWSGAPTGCIREHSILTTILRL